MINEAQEDLIRQLVKETNEGFLNADRAMCILASIVLANPMPPEEAAPALIWATDELSRIRGLQS